MKHTKTEISALLISVYSRLVLTKLNRDLPRFNQVSFMKYQFEKISVKSRLISLMNLNSPFNLGFSRFIFLWEYLPILNQYLNAWSILNQYLYDYSLFIWSFNNVKLILTDFLIQINIYQYLTVTYQYLANAYIHS